MKQNKNFSDVFDDNFEVTYDDHDMTIDMSDLRNTKEYNTDDYGYETDDLDTDDYSCGTDDYDTDDFCEDPDGRPYRDSGTGRSSSAGRKQRRRTSGRRRRGVPLAAPIRKGGRALSKLTSALVRSLTALLIIGTTFYVLYTFWKASTPYGDIINAVETRQITETLAAYLCAPAVFVLYEFIALLWSMTRVRVRNGMETWKEDTGRGLFSFILVFLISYLCFFFYRYLPDSPEILTGIRGAVEVFGSMHNVLFGFCAAGVVSCLIRKYC